MIGTLQKPVFGRLPRIINPCGIPMPKLLLPVNEGTGSIINDWSGNGNVITNTGGVWTSGRFGPAITVDAIDNLTLKTPIVFGAADSWTIIFWAKKSSGEDAYDSQIVGNDVSEAQNHIWLWHGTGFRFYDDEGNWSQEAEDTSFNDVWKQYALRSLNGTIAFFTNGVKWSPAGDATGAFNITNYISSVKQYTFIGDVGALDIFDCALTDSQVAHFYRYPFLRFERDPIELWSAAMGAPPAGIPILRRRIEAA